MMRLTDKSPDIHRRQGVNLDEIKRRFLDAVVVRHQADLGRHVESDFIGVLDGTESWVRHKFHFAVAEGEHL